MGIEALDKRIEEQSEGGQGDYEQLPYVKIHGNSAIVGELTEDSLGFTGNIQDKDNKDESFIVELENPRPLDEEHIKLVKDKHKPESGFTRDTEEGGSSDYKIATDNSKNIDIYEKDGETIVASFGGKFKGQTVEEFDEEKTSLFLRGRGGLEIMRALDVNGDPPAQYTQQGENNKGLIEFPPEYFDDNIEYSADEHGNVRIARYPQIREDLIGETVIIYLKEQDEGNYIVNYGYALKDGEGIENAELLERQSGQPEQDSNIVYTEKPQNTETTQNTESEDNEDLDVSDFQQNRDLTEKEEEIISTLVEELGENGLEGFDYEGFVERNKESGNLPEDTEVEIIKKEVKDRI